VTLFTASAGLALATSGTTGGSTTGGGSTTVTTTGTTGSPTSGTVTTVPATRTDGGTDWGWLRLLGLAGLAGLLRRRDTHTATHVAPAGTTTRT
jgi:hypothetical protein